MLTGQQLDKLTACDAAQADEFGRRVAISGGLAVIGAWGDDDAGGSSGAVYVFEQRGPCPTDINGDGVTAPFDLAALLAGWSPCPDAPRSSCPADLNGDCTVGAGDLALLLAGWGACP